jgi:hypothetical protein
MSTEQYPWYFGRLQREEARIHLENNPDGTFLVRKSTTEDIYVISLMYNGGDKHIRIEWDSKSKLYYVHGGRYFHNVPVS